MFHSPLGRVLRSRMADDRQAENLFILLSTGIALVMLLANQIAWTFVRETILSDPAGAVAIGFWFSQLAAVVLFVGGCVVGFAAEHVVTWRPDGLEIRSSHKQLRIPFSGVESIRTISPLAFYRHYGRYAATRVFVNRIVDEFLLIDTAEGPVVLGLEPDDSRTLQKLMPDGVEAPLYTRRETLLAVA